MKNAGENYEGVETAIVALSDKNSDVRECAAGVLGDMGDPGVYIL
jgi:hypothetical protein